MSFSVAVVFTVSALGLRPRRAPAFFDLLLALFMTAAQPLCLWLLGTQNTVYSFRPAKWKGARDLSRTSFKDGVPVPGSAP